MHLPSTPPITPDPKRLVFFLLKKCAKMVSRWTICLTVGVIAWICFDPLPHAFIWTVIFTMLGAMSIHTFLHQKGVTSGILKQACRLAFFLSIPMLFVFAGNRLAVWGASEETSGVVQQPIDYNVQRGVVPMEEYVALKKLQQEGFKDVPKTKRTVKKFFRKHLNKFKEMDKGLKIFLIVLGIILLVVIVVSVLLYLFINESTNSCLEVSGGSSSSDSSCCMD